MATGVGYGVGLPHPGSTLVGYNASPAPCHASILLPVLGAAFPPLNVFHTWATAVWVSEC